MTETLISQCNLGKETRIIPLSTLENFQRKLLQKSSLKVFHTFCVKIVVLTFVLFDNEEIRR